MKFRVEFGFADNVMLVDEWQTIDELAVVEADSYKEAAKIGANTEGLEKAFFRIYELTENEFGGLEKVKYAKAKYCDGTRI